MSSTGTGTSAESLGRILQQARMLADLSQRELTERLGTEAPHALAHAGLRGDVERFAANLAEGKPAGSA